MIKPLPTSQLKKASEMVSCLLEIRAKMDKLEL